MKNEIRIKPLLASIAIPLAVGGLSGFLTKDGMKTFESIAQPPLSPPGWVFPIAWTILYILMGIACYFVWVSGVSDARRDRALTFYALNLAANFLWSIFFFGFRAYLFSFIWLVLLWALILITTVLFYCIRRSAGKLMIPYLVWVSFAAYLNLGVWILNR